MAPDESGRTGERLGHVVETALAEALSLAAHAGRWETVEAIAAELRARRERAQERAQEPTSGAIDLAAVRRAKAAQRGD